MNKINDYIENLEQKELIMLYMSVVIIFIIIYYFFNMSLADEVEKKNKEYISIYKKSRITTKSVKHKLAAKKLEYKKLLSSQIRQDYKYLQVKLNLSNKLMIKEKRFLDILNLLVQEAIDKNLNASFGLDKKIGEFLIYNIHINGDNIGSIYNLYLYIKDIESKKMVKKVTNLSFDNNLTYHIDVKIWSLK